MPQHLIPGGQGGLSFADAIDETYVSNFTAAKLRHWPKIGAAIDEYILQSILERIERITGLRSSASAAVSSVTFRNTLRDDVYQCLNRGLAIISMMDNVILTDQAPRHMIKSQDLDIAVKQLLMEFGNYGQALNKKSTLSREWMDVCAYRFLEKVSTNIAHLYR